MRNKKENLNLERLSAQMEAVGEKIASAYRTKTVTEQISRSVPLLNKAVRDMERIGVRPVLEP